MREFTDSQVVIGEVEDYEWRFERFLQWVKRQRQGQSHAQSSPTLKGFIEGIPVMKLSDGKRRG